MRNVRLLCAATSIAAIFVLIVPNHGVAAPKSDKSTDRNAPKVHHSLKIGNVTIENRIARSSIAGITCGENGEVSDQRVAMEANFAAGGPGLIISSHVPIGADGRVLPNYAMIDSDERIPGWRRVVEAVHRNGSKYFMQLSHSGRQQDIGGVENHDYADNREKNERRGLARFLPRRRKSPRIKPPSPGSVPDSFHGLEGEVLTTQGMKDMVQRFVRAANRAAQAGVDGIELHSSNGYFFTQCISSAANDRKDEYGGELRNRFRFWEEVIKGIKSDPLAGKLPLVVKLSVIEDGSALKPWARKGNTVEESIQVAKWSEEAGADAIHVSAGDIFPHPLNPAGYLHTEMLRDTYAGLYISGQNSKFNFALLRFLPSVLRLAWERRLRKKLYPNLWSYITGKRPSAQSQDAAWRKLEGLLADSAGKVKANLKHAKVLVTGAWQSLGAIQRGLDQGKFDMVTSARTFMANLDAPRNIVEASRRGAKDWEPERPCSACNRCLVAAPKHPVMCLDRQRFPGATRGERHNAMLQAGRALYKIGRRRAH